MARALVEEHQLRRHSLKVTRSKQRLSQRKEGPCARTLARSSDFDAPAHERDPWGASFFLLDLSFDLLRQVEEGPYVATPFAGSDEVLGGRDIRPRP